MDCYNLESFTLGYVIKMLMQTNVVFMGCRIWIDGESKRDLERAQARLERWILEFIGNPPKFTTVGKKSGTTTGTRQGRRTEGSLIKSPDSDSEFLRGGSKPRSATRDDPQ